MPKTINIPLVAAQDIDHLSDNSVLISINGEHEELPKLKLDRNSSKILTVQFTDICAPIDCKGTIYNPISTETTLKILDFIDKNLGKNFIVHCAAGVSRSAAVCLYLHLFHGYELKENFWDLSLPNPFVLGMLIINSKHAGFGYKTPRRFKDKINWVVK